MVAKISHDTIWKVFCLGKSHVLNKVRQTILLVGFQYGTHILIEIEIHLALIPIVTHDVISETIRKLSLYEPFDLRSTGDSGKEHPCEEG